MCRELLHSSLSSSHDLWWKVSHLFCRLATLQNCPAPSAALVQLLSNLPSILGVDFPNNNNDDHDGSMAMSGLMGEPICVCVCVCCDRVFLSFQILAQRISCYASRSWMPMQFCAHSSQSSSWRLYYCMCCDHALFLLSIMCVFLWCVCVVFVRTLVLR